MDYTLTRFSDAEPMPLALKAKKLYTSEQFEVVHLSLKPGEGMDLHSMPFTVVFVVRSGDGVLQVGNDAVQATAGDCVRVNPGVMRGWRNEGEKQVDIIVMKLIR